MHQRQGATQVLALRGVGPPRRDWRVGLRSPGDAKPQEQQHGQAEEKPRSLRWAAQGRRTRREGRGRAGWLHAGGGFGRTWVDRFVKAQQMFLRGSRAVKPFAGAGARSKRAFACLIGGEWSVIGGQSFRHPAIRPDATRRWGLNPRSSGHKEAQKARWISGSGWRMRTDLQMPVAEAGRPGAAVRTRHRPL